MTNNPNPPRAQESIPNDEQLFRAICQEDLDGTAILPSAVDLQGTSVYRAKYLSCPEETLDFVPGDLTGLAVLTPSGISGAIRNPRVTGKVNEDDVTWEFFAVDDPFTDKDGGEHLAHAEVRVRRLSDRPEEDNVRPSSAMKRLLRNQLARRMTLFLAP